jgi:hypothetical protein
MQLRFFGGLASILASIACKSPDPLPPLSAEDAQTVRRGVELLSTVDPDQRVIVAGKALATGETQRLGTLVDPLAAIARAAPDQRAAAAARGIQASETMLEETCRGAGVSTLETVATAAPDKRLDILWTGCRLDDIDLTTRAEIEGADFITVLLAHMAYHHLKAHGSVSDDERTLLLALAKTPAAAL